MAKKKKRIEIFSSNDDFENEEEATLAPNQQKLYVSLDKRKWRYPYRRFCWH
jgi:hypothetical protein